MTTSTGNLRRLTFSENQNTVPASTRAADLLELAQFLAENTDPFQLLELAAEYRLLLAMALPNLPDEHTERLMLNMVAELHTAEQHDLSDDHNQHDAQQAEVHRQSAAGLARDAVAADLKAAWDRRKVRLAAHYRRISGHVWSAQPPEKWSMDQLVSDVVAIEFPGRCAMTAPMDRRAAYVAGLRALADLIEANPILPLPMESIGHSFYLRGEEAAPALTVLESAGLADREVKVDHEKANYGFELAGRLHGVKIRAIANAADVCKPTGTTVVTTYAYEPTRTPAQAAAPASSPGAASTPRDAAPGEPSAVTQ